ncbi:MAG: tRNA (guanosine(37)-N1)-methyltransferase TrmD [Deltaproteobacteria bacterium]|nr:tRNA (guanosine(37)-N1)-methyltransferase TrmD [Deltaproteobacteria bacterium]
MKINIITLFPEFFQGPLSSGLMQRAVENGLVEFNFINPRNFTDDKRQTVDDRPYGGGPGMVMLLQPLTRALRSLGHGAAGHIPAEHDPAEQLPASPSADEGGFAEHSSGNASGRLLSMSPQGRPLTQALVRELSAEKELTLICGRYEGFDARLNDLFDLEEVSLGDFVLNGGETAALAVCEAVSRLLPGFMGHEESGDEESFSQGLLEYPHYTRPEDFEGLTVPEILRSGDHAKIAAWRRERSLASTLKKRPELLERIGLAGLSKQDGAGKATGLSTSDLEFLKNQPRKLAGRNLYIALLHYPVLDKDGKSTAVSLTNLDIHDISRSSCSYGLGAFFVVTPLQDQRFILDKVLEHWVCGPGGQSNPDRKQALSKVVAADNLEEALAWVERKHGEAPLIWGSSADWTAEAEKKARRRSGKSKKDRLPANGTISFDEAGKILYTRPAILLLGTSHGLAPEVVARCDHLLPPLRRASDYNHFSVRCAATVLLDRLLGEWG